MSASDGCEHPLFISKAPASIADNAGLLAIAALIDEQYADEAAATRKQQAAAKRRAQRSHPYQRLSRSHPPQDGTSVEHQSAAQAATSKEESADNDGSAAADSEMDEEQEGATADNGATSCCQEDEDEDHGEMEIKRERGKAASVGEVQVTLALMGVRG
ncbi:unnamed protein product [Vitrella brassicaformis CCMP3155]|uniref:Uncharacterized protein n=1 Tax=Vitrella brassicaformis (strain CCMP3155) TaxID=1169540 RepID=A0A0G4F4G0_VITBC|nr:unnamed protein product [Vitrella brassicaformis CCMP3155]|mmetsp:Transcript_25849/g.74456  ORF Transcript_25849/g.74456 Transcript_25849/m.74456 type:complete len:159 (+) Transcript_25849:49-525(+)|eukprot:CEM06689.1 unnamed protein product [Vitrella brassicaformis CCMP3155]